MTEYEKKYVVLKKILNDNSLARNVYLTANIISFFTLLPCCFIVLKDKNFDPVVLGTIFGSSGIVGATSIKILKIWDDSLTVVFGRKK